MLLAHGNNERLVGESTYPEPASLNFYQRWLWADPHPESYDGRFSSSGPRIFLAEPPEKPTLREVPSLQRDIATYEFDCNLGTSAPKFKSRRKPHFYTSYLCRFNLPAAFQALISDSPSTIAQRKQNYLESVKKRSESGNTQAEHPFGTPHPCAPSIIIRPSPRNFCALPTSPPIAFLASFLRGCYS